MSAVRRKGEKRPQPSNAVRDSDDHRPRFLILYLCVGLALITSVAFFPALRNNFVNFDDSTYVYENPKIVAGLTVSGITWAFTHFHSGNWHPLTSLSHMLDCQLYRLNAGGHHLTSILLHAVVAILLFIVLQRMTGAMWRAGFVAAVFAIHPLRVESVAWISERKDILSGLFFMLTLAAYVNHARAPSVGRYLLVLLLYALGLMCKPMLVSVPLVLLLVDYWPLGRFTVPASACRLFTEKLPLIGLAAVSCLVTLFAQRSTAVSINHISLAWRVGNAAVACVLYIVQMVWPLCLAPFYPHPADGQLAPGVIDPLPAWQIVLSHRRNHRYQHRRRSLEKSAALYIHRLVLVSNYAGTRHRNRSGRPPGTCRPVYLSSADWIVHSGELERGPSDCVAASRPSDFKCHCRDCPGEPDVDRSRSGTLLAR
jgi:hypothetical protein